jgi:AcrR family transcriptional regulator
VLGTDSERKREAIARAALTLFASDGYERTTVDAIAAEAGVSKRTVYSHYSDKETLFLSVVRDTCEGMLARIAEIIDRVAWDHDLAVALTGCVTDITRSIVRAPERATLTRLLITEAPHFPAVIDLLRTHEIAPLLAAPLERLAAAGRLKISDVRQAADHLAALTFGQVSSRSLLGTVPLSEEETARLIKGGVQVFIRAYTAPAASCASWPAA